MTLNLSSKAFGICQKYWKATAQRKLLPNCCKGCPLEKPCGTSVSGVAGVGQWIKNLNDAAEKIKC